MTFALLLVCGVVGQGIGEEITLPTGTYIAADRLVASDLAKFLRAKDDTGVRKLIEDKVIAPVSAPSRAKILEVVDSTTRDDSFSHYLDLRMLEGPSKDRELWVVTPQMQAVAAALVEKDLAEKVAAATKKNLVESMTIVRSIREEYRAAYQRIATRIARKGVLIKAWNDAKAAIAKKNGVPVALVEEIGEGL